MSHPLDELERIVNGCLSLGFSARGIAEDVAVRALRHAQERVRFAKHGEIAAANIAMLISEIKTAPLAKGGTV